MLRLMSLPIEIMKSIIGDDMELWSDTEKKLSTMWNGKPIYMKSCAVDGVLAAGIKLVDTDDVEDIVGVTGDIRGSWDNCKHVFPYSTNVICKIRVFNKNICSYIFTENNVTFLDLKCTIWYTKTTD